MAPATDIQCLVDTEDAYGCMIDAAFVAFGSDAVLGFVVGGMLVLAFYMGSNYHPAPPAVGTMLIGGLMIPFLPAQYRGMAKVVMLLGFIVGVFIFLRRYVLEVGR